MELKLFISMLLVGAIAVVAKPSQADEGSCDVAGQNRYECGWLGITEETCLKRNCCWDSSDPNAKYCFVKKGTHLPDGLCPIAPSERVECGYYGITKDECLKKTCCWDDTVQDTKWCFRQPQEADIECRLYHGSYGACRYVCRPDVRKMYGMGVCKGRICCWTGYPVGYPGN